jgi:hypothetical protein
MNEEEELDEKDISSSNHQSMNKEIEFQNSLKISVNDQSPDTGPTPYKVAIVGMNELGSAIAFLLICRQIVTDVIIIDRNAK